VKSNLHAGYIEYSENGSGKPIGLTYGVHTMRHSQFDIDIESEEFESDYDNEESDEYSVKC
jgi:hypothetical protein